MLKLDYKAVLALGALGIVAVWYARKNIEEAAEAINPLNDKNIFYTGASGIGDIIAGDGEQKPLGTRLYEWMH